MLVMSRWKFLSTFITLWICLNRVETYKSGAPVSVCGDMVPRHRDYVPQRSPSPYSVLPSRNRIYSGDKLRLTLNSETGASFVGFMLHAKSPYGAGDAIGGFSALPDSAKAITCGNYAKSTATHRERREVTNLEFEWESPQDFEGLLLFNTTFVQNGAVFWVGVESHPVEVVKRSLQNNPRFGISTTKTPIRLTTVPNYTLRPESKNERSGDPIYNGCDSTKSCFGIPDGCIETKSCILLSTVFVRGDTYDFELMAKNSSKGSPKYVALGLSHDQKMGDDSVVECVADAPNRVNVYMSYNVDNAKNNERLNQLNEKVNLKHSKYEDGSIYCKFTRDTVTTVKGKEYDLANGEYYLLLAGGTNLKDQGRRVGWHDVGYEVTGSPRHLSEVGSVSGSSDLLYRLHGAFMMAAWIGFTSVGIVLARYFKMTWVGHKMCGKDQWFIWHRTFMVTTWSLTCAGFVIIFVQVQGWYSETSNPHAILGCITTGLAFIQPFGAALRPSPDSPKRPIFNWLHWLVGNCAHILAIVTIFFAVKLNKAELPDWTDWVLVAYVAFHVLMHLLFSVTGCFSEKHMEMRVNDFPMKDMGSSRSPLHGMDRKRDAPQSYLRKLLLAIYMTMIIVLTVALVVIVVVAPIEDHWAFKEAKKFLTENK